MGAAGAICDRMPSHNSVCPRSEKRVVPSDVRRLFQELAGLSVEEQESYLSQSEVDESVGAKRCGRPGESRGCLFRTGSIG